MAGINNPPYELSKIMALQAQMAGGGSGDPGVAAQYDKLTLADHARAQQQYAQHTGYTMLEQQQQSGAQLVCSMK